MNIQNHITSSEYDEIANARCYDEIANARCYDEIANARCYGYKYQTSAKKV